MIFSISISNSLHLFAKSFSAVGFVGSITGGSGNIGEGVCSGDVLDRAACNAKSLAQLVLDTGLFY